jgi:hypothetical protein
MIVLIKIFIIHSQIIGLQRIINSTTNESLETTYSVKSSDDKQPPCCCCEACKCKCSGRDRKASIHVSNKFLAGASSNRRKIRTASIPSISVTKPKVSVHINARVSLSTYPISESPSPGPDESSRVGFLTNNAWLTKEASSGKFSSHSEVIELNAMENTVTT